jgi:hypothetical protein
MSNFGSILAQYAQQLMNQPRQMQAVPNAPMPQPGPQQMQAVPNAPMPTGQPPLMKPMGSASAFYGDPLPLPAQPPPAINQPPLPIPADRAAIYAARGMTQAQAQPWEDFENNMSQNYKKNAPGTR